MKRQPSLLVLALILVLVMALPRTTWALDWADCDDDCDRVTLQGVVGANVAPKNPVPMMHHRVGADLWVLPGLAVGADACRPKPACPAPSKTPTVCGSTAYPWGRASRSDTVRAYDAHSAPSAAGRVYFPALYAVWAS